LTFNDEKSAMTAYKAIEGATYNDAMLDVEWADDSNPQKKKK